MKLAPSDLKYPCFLLPPFFFAENEFEHLKVTCKSCFLRRCVNASTFRKIRRRPYLGTFGGLRKILQPPPPAGDACSCAWGVQTPTLALGGLGPPTRSGTGSVCFCIGFGVVLYYSVFQRISWYFNRISVVSQSNPEIHVFQVFHRRISSYLMYPKRGIGIHRISCISPYLRCIPRMSAQHLESASAQVELRNDGLKYTEIHQNTSEIRVSQHHTRNTLEYTGIPTRPDLKRRCG